MIRPHPNNFQYTDAEFKAMLTSIAQVKLSGAQGVVFGVLLPDKNIDVERMKTLIDASRPLKVVCHKAFDETPNPDSALDALLSLGVDEVLTSGHCASAVEGVKTLARHVLRSDNKVKIMAGGTVRA